MTALYWLGLTGVLTAIFWAAYVLNRFFVFGIGGSMQNAAPAEPGRLAPWAQRAQRAHTNAVENLVVFATLVLTAHGLGLTNLGSIGVAAQVYFWARLVHYIVYTAGVPGVRTVAFLAGFGAQMVVAFAILSRGAGAA